MFERNFAIAILIGFCCCSCVLPAPHWRLHGYGVTGRIVNQDGEPVANATLAGKYHSDANGFYRIPPIYGLHAAYLIGPICMSLLPAWDMTSPKQIFQVSVSGFKTNTFTIERGLNARIEKSYLRADDIWLEPDLKTQDSALRTQD